ncbi:MAG: TonB-dependent receptor [Chitinophagaceae bacterium]|nr:TonB-dependent receptor [Chitinophagaceae bacterium]
MKLITVLLIAACLQVSANGFSQKVTIKENNISLQKVFEEIKKQTGYQFFYADEVLQTAGKVSLNIRNGSIKEVLDASFKDQQLGYTISENTIIIKRVISIPTVNDPPPIPVVTFIDIRGTVTGENGQPLQGATVLVKGKSAGTKTDANGNFTINAEPNAVLIISYVGYETMEVNVKNLTSIAIQLVPAITIGEQIVVVGYGTQKKSDVSGAVSKVDLEKAKAIPTTNVAEMIRGQAAGVQVTLGSARPGGTSNILIRGRNSIRGGNDPLVVLDGFPIENINDVNPDDIASIEILKDASAQAIYGARASNGVILITTKRGKVGKMRVNVNNYLTTQKLSKNFDLYSAEEFAQLRREARRTSNAVVGGVQPYSPDSVNFGGTTQALEYVNFAKGNYADWEKEVLQTGIINSHTISMSGGNENTKLFSSVNFFNQKGLIPTADYKRGTFRINLEQKINNRASIEANLNLATDKQRLESSNLDFITISPFAGPYDDMGNLVRNVAGTNASSTTINPLWNIRESDNDIKTNLFNLNLVGNYKLTKNFSYKLNTLLSRRYTDQGIYITSIHGSGVTDKGRANVINNLREEYLIENIINYKGQLSDKHKFDATFVQSVNQRNTSRTESEGTGFGNDILRYDGITNALFFKTTRVEEQYRLASFLGRLRYTLMDKYLFTLTSRYDGASVFAENNKWGFFPAAAVAWQMHKEKFLSNVKAISTMKLRVTYGAVGNQSLDPYTTLGVVGNYPYIFNGVLFSGYLPGTQLNNLNLSWETSTTLNAGLDFGLFNNRLTGSIDYFNTRTTDLLTDISLSGTGGYTNTITNGGETKNHGLEILLSGNIIRNKDFNWNVTTSYTRYRNEIVKTGVTGVDGEQKNDIGRGRYVGTPINNIRTYVFDGIFQTDDEAKNSAQGSLGGTITPFQNVATLLAGAIRLKDVNGDGKITDDDQVVFATDPKWFSSISTTFSYKNFDLLADLYIVEGTMKSNPYLSSFNEGGTLQSVRNGIKVDYWTPENPSTTFPRPNYGAAPQNVSSLGLRESSYVRLRTLSLGYNMQNSLLDKMKLSGLRVYITASNLFTITDYKSYSPENNPNQFPDTKSFTFGLNIGL